jgi:hypothetical protein
MKLLLLYYTIEIFIFLFSKIKILVLRQHLMATLIKRSGEAVTARLGGRLLEMEGTIQEATNAAGRCVTEKALRRFDTDGRAIRVGEIKRTARAGAIQKSTRGRAGRSRSHRYVYQSSRGGRIYCPLEPEVIDQFHTVEYVGEIAQALYPHRHAAGKRGQWQHEHCQQLKHDPNTLDVLIGEAARLAQRRSLAQKIHTDVLSAWTYFTN